MLFGTSDLIADSATRRKSFLDNSGNEPDRQQECLNGLSK
jgi:hypothetical protein